MMIDGIGVRRLGGFKLELEFSDGTIGVRDFESIRQRSGTMAGPAGRKSSLWIVLLCLANKS